MRVHRAKFNSYRRPEFQMATLIVEDGEGTRVVKRPLDERARPHLEGLAAKCEKMAASYPTITVLRPTYRDGTAVFDLDTHPSLQARLASLLKADDEKGFESEVRRYVSVVGEPATMTDGWWEAPGFAQAFGRVEESDMHARKCLSPSNVDMGFSNIHVAQRGEGAYRLFDCEWTFDFPVPLDYVLWRPLTKFHRSFRPPFVNDWRVERLFGLADIKGTDLDLFKRMEERFQTYVFGESTFNGLPEEIVGGRPWLNFDELVSWVERAQSDIERLRAAYENSFSWRITKPVRMLSGTVKRLIGRR